MTLIQQARALEARIEALEARSGQWDNEAGVLAEIRDLKGAATRLDRVEADLSGLQAIEDGVARLQNQGDPRPILEALGRRLAALEDGLGKAAADQARVLAGVEGRVQQLERVNRFKPIHMLVWLLSTSAAGVVASRSGLEPLMVAGVTAAAALGVGALLRAGN